MKKLVAITWGAQRMRFVLFFAIASVLGFTFASFATSPVEGQPIQNDSVDGNTIAEPSLIDYRYGYRAPGILFEPYDQVDNDGNPVVSDQN